jgi:hypothetical protein
MLLVSIKKHGSSKMIDQVQDLKKVNKEIVDSLQQLVGLIGTKLNIDKQDRLLYQQWDCTTTKHSKVESWGKNPASAVKVVNYSKSSFFKSYPLIFDSSNLDPTKTWLMGCQIAAINCQKLDDDFTLLNQVFFSLNRNNGYILKPKYLRNGKFYDNTQNAPLIKKLIDIHFISGCMLHTLSSNKIKEISIGVNVYGSYEDDKFNPSYSFKKITEKFINPIFDNEKLSLSIYNPDLSFIFIKIQDGSNTIGRGVIPIRSIMQGFRLISLYDNECKLKEQALLSCIINIKEIN